ncbi:MAG TPA: zinc-dependent metalloprotease family protein [Caldilineaceae bacterium]|nr:zinc-dependent metalloprotease family protein [Caldilineaceae bacterium]
MSQFLFPRFRTIFLSTCFGLALLGTFYGLPTRVLFAQSTAQEEPPVPFFEDRMTVDAAAVAPTSPAIVRQRAVAIAQAPLTLLAAKDTSAGAAAQPVLQLNFFDDVTMQVVLQEQERHSDGTVVWQGIVADQSLSSAVFVVRAGAVTANVRSAAGLYQIRPLADGRHLVRQVDASQFARDPNDGRTITLEAVQLVETQSSNSVTAAAQALTTADDGATVDVLIAYAPAARIAAGGTQAIRDRIDLAIAEANQIYANSQINTRLRLAYAYETNYDTSGSQATDLDRLTYSYDGYMEEVHELRNTYGADLVSLWVEGGDYCGIAWIRSTAAFAFSVMDRWCAENTVTFAHELGHNFGARHDWYVDGYVDTPSYNKGVVDLTGRWISVMSYYSKCYAAGVSCNEIPYFSNPNVLYNGRATGVRAGTSTACQAYNLNNPACDAENYRVHNERAYTVANFRQSRQGVDLMLSNVDLVDPVQAGDEITYQLTVDNVGIDSAANVSLVDQLPTGTTFARTTNSSACSHNAGTVTCNFGTLAGRASVAVDLTVRTTANTPSSVVNQATVSTSSGDVALSNNSAEQSTRVQGNGADTSVLFVSSTSNGWLGILPFADEDIVAYDDASNLWYMVVDASDIGIKTDINGFEWLPDGSLLLTLDRPTAIAGLGTVDDSDILRFIPTRLGATTAGTLEYYLDGSDVGLTTNGEDIDAIALSPEGDLIISTLGGVAIGTLRGRDEDLLRFHATQLGAHTAGTWEWYFDGSDVGLTDATEDIFSLWIDAGRNEPYFSMAGPFAVKGLSGQAWDISFCTPVRFGSTTACTFTNYWHGSDYGFGGEVIDGLAFGAMPALLNPTAANEQAAMNELATDADLLGEVEEIDDHLDDTNDADTADEDTVIFVPLVSR